MIEADMRQAICLLHREGMSLREITRRLAISRNTVRDIVAREGLPPAARRRDKIQLDRELLGRLHQECDGWVQRIHEKLAEEHGIAVTYSTLARRLREYGIGKPPAGRCDRVADEPGAEMQHDTSPFKVRLADKPERLVASVLYLRYCKRRYLKFYRGFNRFAMKCFLHEALMFWGCAAPQCIIDNTNLARLRGSGRQAVMTPEMEAFARQYGFAFRCHEIGHANRKAGEERGFYTVETNFLPGRSFASLEDLNAQALQWATVRMEQRPQGEGRLIPAQAFEHERAFLTRLPPHLPAPYQVHERPTDQYGFIAFAGNYYWVPGTGRDAIKVLQYGDRIKLYRQRECLAEYPLPADGERNRRFSPPGLPEPRHQPNSRHRPTQEEERRLRALGPAMAAWLDFALADKGPARHRFFRELFALSRRATAPLLLASVERALKYRIADLPTLERILVLNMTGGLDSPLAIEVDENYRQRDACREGWLTDAPDLSVYDDPAELEQDGEDHE